MGIVMLTYVAAVLTTIITIAAVVGDTWDKRKPGTVKFTLTGWVLSICAVLLLAVTMRMIYNSDIENRSMLDSLRLRVAEVNEKYENAIQVVIGLREREKIKHAELFGGAIQYAIGESISQKYAETGYFSIRFFEDRFEETALGKMKLLISFSADGVPLTGEDHTSEHGIFYTNRNIDFLDSFSNLHEYFHDYLNSSGLTVVLISDESMLRWINRTYEVRAGSRVAFFFREQSEWTKSGNQGYSKIWILRKV